MAPASKDKEKEKEKEQRPRKKPGRVYVQRADVDRDGRLLFPLALPDRRRAQNAGA